MAPLWGVNWLCLFFLVLFVSVFLHFSNVRTCLRTSSVKKRAMSSSKQPPVLVFRRVVAPSSSPTMATNLRRILGNAFNWSISKVNWPQKLQYLMLSAKFNQYPWQHFLERNETPSQSYTRRAKTWFVWKNATTWTWERSNCIVKPPNL